MPFHYAHQIFDDIDEICEKINGVDIRLIPLKKGEIIHRINLFSSENVVVQNMTIGQKAHHVGVAPKNRVTFGLPSREKFQIDLNGHLINDALVIFSRGDEFSSVSPEGYNPTTISIDRNWLQQFAIFHEIPVDIEAIDSNIAVIPISPQIKTQFKRIFMCIASEKYALKAREYLIQYELPLLLLQLSFLQEKSIILKVIKKANTLERAFNFIQLNSKTSISIKQVCEASCIQERSLERGFKEYFGISPNNYLRLYRLQQAKIQIKKSKGIVKISDVALNCGFTHLGRFSNYYGDLFNELPRETMLKSRVL
ncbi:MAG: helix-turn-helix transcriptional regulator [Psychromonas sp.]